MFKQMSHEHFSKVSALTGFQVWLDQSISELSLPGIYLGAVSKDCMLQKGLGSPCIILGMCPCPNLATNEVKRLRHREPRRVAGSGSMAALKVIYGALVWGSAISHTSSLLI